MVYIKKIDILPFYHPFIELSYSYSFEKIQGEARRIWRFYFFNLIYEYQQMTSLPPPLSLVYYAFVIWLAVFYLIWRGFEKILRSYCTKSNGFCTEARGRIKDTLLHFLETPLRNYSNTF